MKRALRAALALTLALLLVFGDAVMSFADPAGGSVQMELAAKSRKKKNLCSAVIVAMASALS